MLRQSRKLDHIENFLHTRTHQTDQYFKDIHLVHSCIPQLNMDDISMETAFMGYSIPYPFYINAITGGAPDVTEINAALARVANHYKLPMAVGSQMAAIENHILEESYTIVRKENPNGLIFANIGAYATPEMANKAVSMIDANAIQIHLNVAQELMMPEGDRHFSQWLSNIEAIVKAVSVPVIIKEVGFGVAKEDAKRLIETGIDAIDIGGSGGTDFIAIELLRRDDDFGNVFMGWGIPTPVSLVEAADVLRNHCTLIASGGISNGLDGVKMLALGADAIGISGVFLRELLTKDIEALEKSIIRMIEEIRMTMALVGAKNILSLKRTPVVIMGNAADWLQARGIDIKAYGMRNKQY